MSPCPDNPELLKARVAALSRLIPFMYFVLVANSWLLSFSFLDHAPVWLTVHVTLLLSAVCAWRLFFWWRMRGIDLTVDMAVKEFRRTNRAAALLSGGFVIWALALYRHAGPLQQGQIAFFMALSMLATMLCLIHLRSAACIVAAVVGSAFVLFFASSGNPVLASMALNVLLVTASSLVVVMIHGRTFASMVDAQTDARRREQAQSRLLRMIDDMPVAVMTVDPKSFAINYVNETSRRLLDRIEHLLPVRGDQLVGTPIDLFHDEPEQQRRLLSDPARLPHRTRIQLGPEVLDLQISAVNDDDGSFIGPMLSWAIVTKEVDAENRIRYLAHHDALTGLANRSWFGEQLDRCFAHRGDGGVALLFIDLDGFKLINDTRGHQVGDALLRLVAERLRGLCDAPDMVAARIGGDEFAVLVPGADAEAALALAASIVERLSQPYVLDDRRRIQLGASIGIALAPLQADDGETLLARADIALYSAKTAGRNMARLFSTDIEHRLQERVRLESKLRAALDSGAGLFVFYQPIFDLRSGVMTSREALVRWHHPVRGWIPPAEFVPVAEQSGLIEQLGLFVLDRACRDAAGRDDGVRVAVNVSAGQLGKGTLAQGVRAALAATGLAPERLEVEVTETALIERGEEAIADLREIRAMGVRIALDDFGTGYSSLAHLRVFPFDRIKIDGSFVRDAADRADCAAVVGAIADLGRRLGVTTVAEGVETRRQYDRALIEGCDEAQGHYFGRAMPGAGDAAAVEALAEP